MSVSSSAFEIRNKDFDMICSALCGETPLKPGIGADTAEATARIAQLSTKIENILMQFFDFNWRHLDCDQPFI